LEALRGVLSLLTDVNNMRQHAQLLLSGDANGLAFEKSDAGLFGVVAVGLDADVPMGEDDETVTVGVATAIPLSPGEQNPLFF
jgi:hypothetical protein